MRSIAASINWPRVAAAISLVLLPATFALAVLVAVDIFPRGLAVPACLLLAGGAAWYGLLRRGIAHVLGLAAAALAVAGAVAPKATIAVYFAPNTNKGFLDAINFAIHDAERKPSVISISWGGPEVAADRKLRRTRRVSRRITKSS